MGMDIFAWISMLQLIPMVFTDQTVPDVGDNAACQIDSRFPVHGIADRNSNIAIWGRVVPAE
jgi:hypothetical protein